MADILHDFYLAEATLFKVGPSKEELYPVAGGVKSIAPSFEETTEEVNYFEQGSMEYVTGTNYQIEVDADRMYSNEAQNYIRELLIDFNNRDGYMQITEPDGRVLEGPAVFKGISPFGGEAGQRQQFKFTARFQGTPTDTPKK